jgi:hypothetical protein
MVGKKAEKILVYADVLTSGKERMLGPVAIPVHDNCVVFDLEGMPPHLDELEKINLWGMRVYGKRPSEVMGVTAGFGKDGDRGGVGGVSRCCHEALRRIRGHSIFPLASLREDLHQQYIDRYGDTDGIAALVIRNLLDLLPVTKNAIALPLPSYSLKVVEEHVGFKRTQDELEEAGRWRNSSWQPFH